MFLNISTLKRNVKLAVTDFRTRELSWMIIVLYRDYFRCACRETFVQLCNLLRSV